HNIVVTATPESIPADGRTSSRIEVRVTDAFGNNVGAGHSVSFITTLGTVSPSIAYTNTNGIATTNLISATTPGVALLSVSCETVWETIEITFLPTGASSMLLTANPTSLVADGVSQSIITVTVYDSAGNYVSDGTLIRFEVIKPDTIHNYGNVVSTRPTVGGTAVTTYTSGTKESNIYIKAMATLNTDTLVDSVLVRLIPGPPATIIATADSDTIHANGSSTTWITATALDGFGNTVPGGTIVQFSTSLGEITQSSITDTSGVARVALVAGYSTGTATVTITSGNAIGFVEVSFIPTVATNIFVSVSKPTLIANGEDTSRVEASVHDVNGNLSSDNIPVNFEIIPNGGYFLPNRVPTQGGKALTKLRADTIAVGQRTIRAYVVQGTDTISGTSVVKFVPGPPANISVTAEDSIIPADGVSYTVINVELRDRFSNPVSAGIPVTFTTSIGNITGISVTDTLGRASAILTSSTTVGTAIITIRSGDAIAYTQVRFSPLLASRIELLVIPHSLPGDGVSSAEIIATVLDSAGNPVSDRTRVRFYQDT
ncbi:MAG: invasin domain 3-containing protein, partial [bacterium]